MNTREVPYNEPREQQWFPRNSQQPITRKFEQFIYPNGSIMIPLEETIEELHFNDKNLLYCTIQTLNRGKKYDKLNTLCKLYLKNNTEEDSQRKMVQFFQAFSLFHSHPTKSRR